MRTPGRFLLCLGAKVTLREQLLGIGGDEKIFSRFRLPQYKK